MPPTRNNQKAPPATATGSSNAFNLGQAFTTRETRSGTRFSPFAIVLDNVDLDSLYSRRLDEQAARKDQGADDVEVVPGDALPDEKDDSEPCSANGSPRPSTNASSSSSAPPALSLSSTGKKPSRKDAVPRPISRCRAPQPNLNSLSPPISSSEPSRSSRAAKDPAGSREASQSSSLSAKENSKRKKALKRAASRAESRAASSTPYLKGIALQRARNALKSQVRVATDTAELGHSVPAWIGLKNPDNAVADGAAEIDVHASVLEGKEYTQEEVDGLAKAYGLRYLRWNGRQTIAIVDLRRRLLALLGGQPGGANWSPVIEGATVALEERAPRVKLAKEKMEHRRAETPFCPLARGVSHGGGQTEPGELLMKGENRRVTDELLEHDAFKKIVGFTSYLFWLWMPMLYAAYFVARERYADEMPWLRFPFENGVFAACTWNFVNTVCAPHVDFANLVWGWCSITALGRFNPDRGGHLILWDLRLIIRFPPGATIFIPSALLTHSNTPIGPGESRSSFVQYSAGGLFRWIDQKFQTQDAFWRTATEQEKREAAGRAENRWAFGLGHFSVIDRLFK